MRIYLKAAIVIVASFCFLIFIADKVYFIYKTHQSYYLNCSESFSNMKQILSNILYNKNTSDLYSLYENGTTIRLFISPFSSNRYITDIQKLITYGHDNRLSNDEFNIICDYTLENHDGLLEIHDRNYPKLRIKQVERVPENYEYLNTYVKYYGAPKKIIQDDNNKSYADIGLSYSEYQKYKSGIKKSD